MHTHEDSSAAARARHEFRAPLEKEISSPASLPQVLPPPQILPLSQIKEQTAKAIQYVNAYLRQQRAHYFATTRPLSTEHKAAMWPYFPARLLDQVRIVELEGQRVATPIVLCRSPIPGF